MTHGPQPRATRQAQWWFAALGIGLMLLLSACGGTPTSSQSAGQSPAAIATPGAQVLQARANTAPLLDQYQRAISQAHTYGLNVTPYQEQLSEDTQDFQNAQTVQAYQTLAKSIQTQMTALQQTVLPSKTSYDLNELQTLIGQTDINNDYEYRDADDAYLQERSRFQQARATADYQKVDTQVDILINNLQALLTNLSDKTPHDQAHATDLQLLQDYNAMTGQAIIVSFTEQTMRLYLNGELVGWMYVVTGQRAAQSPPGLWHVLSKQTHLVFKSSEPKGSALWYPDTPINYALMYHTGGYYLHDATWRWYFGPGANLPHADYSSGRYSDTGTHGCINMTLANAQKLYNWANVGIPVIVY